MILFWTLLAAALLAAFFLTGLMRRYALRTRLMDIPNARSSHTAPTPRGGGLAIVAVVLAGLALSWAAGMLSGPALAALGLGGAAVAAVGWLDDRAHVPARRRLTVHLAAAAWAVLLLGAAPPLVLPWGSWAWGWLGSALLVLFIGWVVNLYNFMDGIDGLAGVEAVTVAGVAAGLLWWLGEPGWALIAGLIAAASLGFLGWNWPPARIFMGDAGSGFLGFCLAGLAVWTWASTGMSLWAWLILLGAFIVDASLTLVRRLLRGDRVHEAHRRHAYQYAARRYGSHRPVTVAVGIVTLLWLAPLAFAATVWPAWGAVLLALAWAPLVAACLGLRAGLPEAPDAA